MAENVPVSKRKVAKTRLARLCALTACAYLSSSAVEVTLAEDIIVKPTGAYATIDTSLSTTTIQQLKNATPEQRDKMIAKIQSESDKYIPPIFYLIAAFLFQEGKKDEAAFWFYAGQLRGRYDANRCADVSARSAIGVLNHEFGGPINRYALADIPKLELLIPKVVEWDRNTPHSYDQRWINLHGMNAMISGLDDSKSKDKQELSLPKDQWDAMAEKTRKEYTEQFKAAIEQLKSSKQQ